MRRLGRSLRALLLIWLATLVAVILWTVLWPLDRPVPRGDAIVCLGGGVDVTGRLGPASVQRAETCAALARDGAAQVIIFSGGPAREGAPTGAAGMADVARAAGIGRAEVVIEPRAASTLQNALFTRDLLPADARTILVSNTYHLPRSWASYRVMGVDDLALVPSGRWAGTAPGGLPWRTFLRESLAIWFNAGRFVVWQAAGLLGMPEPTRTTLLH
jgi:uncharacterized SAM-binding protein YcdF (DUF218 family)